MSRGDGSYPHRQFLIAVKEDPPAAGFVLQASAQTSAVLQTADPTRVSGAESLQGKRTTLGNIAL